MTTSLQLPPTYILKTRFTTQEHQDELHRLEKEIKVKWNIREAKLVLGKVMSASRAAFDLRGLGLYTESVENTTPPPPSSDGHDRKRRRIEKENPDNVVVISSDSDSGTIDESQSRPSKRKSPPKTIPANPHESTKIGIEDIPDGQIKVLNIEWYYASVQKGKLLPIKEYLVYHAQILPEPTETPEKKELLPKPGSAIMARAREDTPPPPVRRFGQYQRTATPTSQGRSRAKVSQLLHENTEDHDAAEDMPPIPDYLHSRWSCERPTPMHSPNDDFIEQLKIIRHARELQGADEHHAYSDKSYSAGIAVIQAYPHRITSVQEVLRLPGCGEKIASDWIEWHNTGEIQEVNEIKSNDRLQALSVFFGIHGVAGTSARKFYDSNQWKDLDDLIELGWDTLTRDQQVGVKYYDELQLRIPRSEVAATEQIILGYANKLYPGFKICTVGGYRRGKETSGDMDFILSHPDENVTKHFIGQLLDLLIEDKWIVHELTVSFRNSDRGQETLAWRDNQGKKRSGFDTLDHAFVVWRNPNKPKEKGKEYPHRRVDIIISPWKTAGCAVLGWTGGKLFEQHLRSFVKHKHGWKFDSSGVRSRGSGKWMDLETRAEDKGREDEITLEEKERRVIEGLGLPYLVPTLRCTH